MKKQQKEHILQIIFEVQFSNSPLIKQSAHEARSKSIIQLQDLFFSILTDIFKQTFLEVSLSNLANLSPYFILHLSYYSSYYVCMLFSSFFDIFLINLKSYFFEMLAKFSSGIEEKKKKNHKSIISLILLNTKT